MKRRLPIIAALVFLVTTTPAHGQEPGDAGVAMGFPAAVSVIWHVSDTFALRPEFAITHGTSESETSLLGGRTSSTDIWALAVGVSAPWYLGGADYVRTYVSPRFAYSRTSNDFSDSLVGLATGDTVSASGSFGVQYWPVRKSSIYGEIGCGFNRSTSELETPIGRTATTSWNWATRSSVGVVFYFRRR